MTNYKELIAEADALRSALSKRCSGKKIVDMQTQMELAFARLAAAVRELAPLEGWESARFIKNDGSAEVTVCDEGWHLYRNGAGFFRDPDGFATVFPTASAAMAALDGEHK